MLLSTLEIGEVQLRSVALKSRRNHNFYLSVSRTPIGCGLHAGAKAIWHSVNLTLI